MDCIATRIPYRQTNEFSKIALDYIDQSGSLSPFFSNPPTLQGIKKTIEAREKYKTDRKLLVEELKKQYSLVETRDLVKKNIEALADKNTFTVTTAHQPNIFTGPLYFIYKILHVIKLAGYLDNSLPGNKFVPVYYIGSEDADLDELGHFYIQGEKYTWNTKQAGAVGRMKVDKELLKLIETVSGQLAVFPHGTGILSIVRECYQEGTLIQDATFRLLNHLFGKYGLIILIPDNDALKKQMINIFEDDLLNQTASALVENTAVAMQEAGYRQQVNPREINLFYLGDNTRERIEKKNNHYSIVNTPLTFKEDAMLDELKNHPGRFSPNVILRGLYQETILPDVVFVGGGGELAYWLQYRKMFEHYKTVFPVLLLRNSFLLVEKKWQEKIAKLDVDIEDFFQPAEALLNKIVERETQHKVRLNGVFEETEKFYEQLKKQVSPIDISLVQHIDALKTRSINRLHELEKKMLRAEKRKFSDQQRQIMAIREKLFPANGLQERVDNFMSYYAKWGEDFFNRLFEYSLCLEQEFVVISEK